MSKLIDFFKIIGAKSNNEVELSQEEIIQNAADLSKEQKKLLIDSLRISESEAKKIDIDAIAHTESRRVVNDFKTTKTTRRVKVESSKEKDDELTK